VFVVHTPKGVVEFKPSERGIHYIDVTKEGDLVHHMLVHIETDNKRTSSDEGFVMVNTVRGNFDGYTKHNIKKAQEARHLQGMIGNPIERKFMGMVRESQSPISQSQYAISMMLTKFLVPIFLT
jgi:hypothetical protein